MLLFKWYVTLNTPHLHPHTTTPPQDPSPSTSVWSIPSCATLSSPLTHFLCSQEKPQPKVLVETREEYARRGQFVRIFPTEDSWDLYGLVACTHTHTHTLFIMVVSAAVNISRSLCQILLLHRYTHVLLLLMHQMHLLWVGAGHLTLHLPLHHSYVH